MARQDGRVEKGQSIRSAFSAKAWNRAQDAADIVLGVQPGLGAGSIREASHYLAKTTSQWTKGTSQTLNLWAGTPGSESQLSDQVIAWNYVATLPSGLLVVLARTNASFYLASFDYTGLSGYSGSVQQVLGHNASGQLVWLSTTACP